MGIIYKVTSPAGRVYVGQTFDIRKRLNAHKYSVKKKNSRHVILINSFKKYGFDEHQFEILEIIENCNEKTIDEKEIFWIKELNTYNLDNPLGMNMTLGGEGQRGRLDKRRKEIVINNLFKKGIPFKGKQHTEENKRLASEREKERSLRENRRIPEWGIEKGRILIMEPIICYDLDGNFIKEFKSYTEAAKEYNKTPSLVRDAVVRFSCFQGKYYFTKKTEKYPFKIQTNGLVFANSKRKVLYLNKELNVIKEYPSALEASEDLKIPKTTINRAAQYNNLKPIRSGHIFIYQDMWN